MKFCNNLKDGDRILDTGTAKHGKVSGQPRESTVMVTCLFDGQSTEKRIHIMNLRLTSGGRILEDVPPCDGEPPFAAGPSIARLGLAPAFDLKGQTITARAACQAELTGMNARATILRGEIDRYDRVLAVLEGK